jgi:site-specific recombinase XerD
LDCAVELIISQSLAANTIDAYGTGQRAFATFCAAHGVPTSDQVPASAELLISFVTYLHSTGKNLLAATISTYLCHVKMLFRMVGASVDAFNDTRLQLAMRAIKRTAKRSSGRSPRLPITFWLARDMISLLDLTDQDHCAAAAAISVGSHGLFRSGEITLKPGATNLLRRADVSFSPDGSYASIFLAESKTDVFRQGVTIRVARTGTSSCPVALLRAQFDSAPNKSPTAPLFQKRGGLALSYRDLTAAIKTLTAKLGLTGNYSGHSLRVGGATSLALMGFQDHEIQTLGRWRSLSYQLYVRSGPELANRASQAYARLRVASGTGYYGGMSINQACSVTLDNIGSKVVAFSS